MFSLPVDEQEEEATFYSLMFIVIGVVQGVGMLAQSATLAMSGETLTMRLRQMAFKAFLKQVLKISFFSVLFF